jgi:hypothetical protein
MAFASLPVLLVAIGELIVQFSSLARGWSYLIVALTGLTISVGVSMAGLGMFKRVSAFQRSREELIKNLLWLKKIWKKPSRRFSTNEAGCAEPRRPAHR